ncbi:Phosphoserine phosphatase, partial [hydrothermal vent metagenome]
MLIATFIAAETLKKGELSSAQDHLSQAGCNIVETSQIIDERVAEISFEGDPAIARNALTPLTQNVDIAILPTTNRRKKLLISDMDSTMITVECIDELASYAGIKEKIAEITERAMQGELDFEDALRGRVALLTGLDVSAVQKCLDEKVRIMPGAKTLVRTMRENGATTILVSGGFTSFANPVARQIGFGLAEANILGESEGKLSGKLGGQIVDSKRKAEILKSAAHDNGLSLDDCLAVGDGANDIPM